MIVRFRTRAQAERASTLTGCPRVLIEDKRKGHEGEQVPGRDVMLPCTLEGFEEYREAVESVSALYDLIDDDGTALPKQWRTTAARFEVSWPKEPERVRLIHAHFGARRYAYNWALATVKADMTAKRENPEHESTPWTVPALQKRWNVEKRELAPWWSENSKHAYETGIVDLVRALEIWSSSKSGRRKGRKTGFPRFKSKRRDPKRVRFKEARLEDDRRDITLPVIRKVRSKRNTRRVRRHVAKGNARLLSMTLSERSGRLFVSISYVIRTSKHTRPMPRRPDVTAGVDLGFNDLATISDTDGRLRVFKNPRPLRATLAERRRVSKQLSRRIPGSRGYESARTKLALLDRRCSNLRRESAHRLTAWLADEYGQAVIEDLDVAAMVKGMGRRAFRRGASDSALGLVRPMLAYKMGMTGREPVLADRWFPSSQLHHDCQGAEGNGCRLLSKKGEPGKLDKLLVCPQTGVIVHRDVNASKNLRDYPQRDPRDWPGHANFGPVGAKVPLLSSPTDGGGECGSGERLNAHRGRPCKTRTSVWVVASEARTSDSTRKVAS